jgi:hypothetical protein
MDQAVSSTRPHTSSFPNWHAFEDEHRPNNTKQTPKGRSESRATRRVLSFSFGIVCRDQKKAIRSSRLANGQTIRTIAWAADVRQDCTLPENGTAANRGRQRLSFQTLHIAELGTFRRLTLPEIPSSLLLICPTYSLLDIRKSDLVLCRLAIVEF